ncbi:hypothetical protein ACIBEA_00185 [Streptomyces sp. NPDC051555]|uniref:hypothetical protein n=1 Tax=Streptomyces sp. NPDC051555 TaxID=3365657 RepID=UPI0037B4273A
MTRTPGTGRRAGAALAVALAALAALAAMASAPGALAAPAPNASAQLGAFAFAFAYVANLRSDTVSVIDTRTDTVVDSVRVGDGPDSVAVTPDGAQAVTPRERGPGTTGQ